MDVSVETCLLTMLTGQRMLSMMWPPLFLVVWVMSLGLSLGSSAVNFRLWPQAPAARLDGKDRDGLRQLAQLLLHLRLLTPTTGTCPTLSAESRLPRLALLLTAWLMFLPLPPKHGCGQPKLPPVSLALMKFVNELPSSPSNIRLEAPGSLFRVMFLVMHRLTTGLNVLPQTCSVLLLSVLRVVCLVRAQALLIPAALVVVPPPTVMMAPLPRLSMSPLVLAIPLWKVLFRGAPPMIPPGAY